MAALIFDLDEKQAQASAKQVEREILADLDRAVDKLLEAVANVQILAYGQDDNPSKPAGSTYTRTFDLRAASSTERTGPLGGRWFADESLARYAEVVIGPRSRQAAIHQGRWKSTEEVEQVIERQAPEIIEKELAR